MASSDTAEMPDATTSAPCEEPAVSVAGLRHDFSGGHRALDGVDLDVRRGEFLSIVGPSGCGKSTLLSFVAGLARPSAGEVTALGGTPERARPRIGFVFQRDALLPWRTALDNVALPLRLRGAPRREARATAAQWLERVGLPRAGAKYPRQLSGGMRKRVAIAATLAYQPELLLMDEPFSALDVQTRLAMENDLLTLWAEQRSTVVFVTHDLEEAVGLSDRVALLSASPGRIVATYDVPIERPRDLLELRFEPSFRETSETIWHDLRREVARAENDPTRGEG
ncbi:ABC transporter ATP-binding protein [Actinomadura chibensis]|nr:ABC transporter ATP-binding protein [Actinomadura chibensis]